MLFGSLTSKGQKVLEIAMSGYSDGAGLSEKAKNISYEVSKMGVHLSVPTLYRIRERKRSRIETIQALFTFLHINGDIFDEEFAVPDEFSSRINIVPAMQSQLKWIANAENLFFNTNISNQHEMLVRWYDKNPDGFFVITLDEDVVGNLVLVSIKEPSLAAFKEGTITERDIPSQDIYSSDEADKATSIYIESLMINIADAEQRNTVFRKIVSQYERLLRGVCFPKNLRTMYALGASEAGYHLLKGRGFEVISTDRKDHRAMFTISALRFLRHNKKQQ